MKHPKKKFLKLPEYPGGKEALKAYIKENLVYPEKALANKIEGTVLLIAEIDDNGHVGEVTVSKSLGFGCDEEAVRLLKNIRFSQVKNKGVRVKTRKRFKINFKLPPQKNIQFTVSKKSKESKKAPSDRTYSYQIKL